MISQAINSWTSSSGSAVNNGTVKLVPMSSTGEQVAHDVVDREEPFVGVASGVVDNRRHDDPLCGAVAPEAIGDEAARDTAAPLEQFAKEPSGGVISARPEQDVK
jgi:hypothetical protein